MQSERMRVITNRLTATGKPYYLRGDVEEDCPGEWLHYDYLAKHVGVGTVGLDRQVDTKFAVIPEPENPYDPNAVAVSISNHHVGYLPASVAQVYAPILASYIAEGLVPFIDGQIYTRLLPADKDHPEPKEWVKVHLYVEDVELEDPIPVWDIPGTRELADQGAGLLDYEEGSFWATAEGHELDALKHFVATFDGEYALVGLVLLPAERPNRARRVGIQHEGVTLGRLSAVSSGRYRDKLLAAEVHGTKLAVVIRVPRRYWRNGCDVLIARDLVTLIEGQPVADFEFSVERRPVPFTLSGAIADGPEVAVDFETIHLYYDEDEEHED